MQIHTAVITANGGQYHGTLAAMSEEQLISDVRQNFDPEGEFAAAFDDFDWDAFADFYCFDIHTEVHELTPDLSPKMYARLTAQGTAACETAACGRCLATATPEQLEFLQGSDPVEPALTEHRDCTGNEALVCQLCGLGGTPEESEIRASELKVGDRFAEYGMDPETVARRDDHGDTVLIWTKSGIEMSLDIDTVVALNPEEDD